MNRSHRITNGRPLSTPASPGRRGLTLTELLAVIVVLMILASMTVGALRPTMQGRQIREAARVVNSALTTARYRAQGNNRPAGVMLEPLPGGLASANLVPVEEPPPYGGDVTGAFLLFAPSPPAEQLVDSPQFMTGTLILSDGQDPNGHRSVAALITAGVIARGDRLQVGYKNATFLLADVTEDDDEDLVVTLFSTSTNPRWPALAPQPFLFHRRPRPSSVAAIQLPDGAVVDLTGSGFGTSGTFNPTLENPVIIMFSPSGHVDRIFHENGLAGQRGNLPIHFLIGRIDQVTSGSPLTSRNLGDLANRWVSVNALTGKVGTFEMAALYSTPGDSTTTRLENPQVTADNITQARRFMRKEEYVPPEEP